MNKVLLLGSLFFAIFATDASAQRSLDVGTISRVSMGRTVPVYWELRSENFGKLLDRALNLNGGFAKVSPEAASVIIDIREIGGGVSELTLLGTKPKRILYSERFEGGRAGALKAANRAVEKILGVPGFYTGKIAFVSDRTGHSELYISDFFFQNVRQITSDKAHCSGPKLSPDGRILNYTGYYKSGYPDLFRIDLASGKRTPIASFSGLNSGGAWNAASNTVAYVISSSGNPEIYLGDPLGRKLRRLTRTPSIETSPSFSPDGQKLVFTSDLAGKPQLYLMDVVGGPMNRLPTNVSSYCAEPVWNPFDPNLIAFTVAAGGEFEIAIYDFAKKQSRIMTRGAGDAIEPTWLNDGRHLIYTARTSNSRQLYILDSETGRAAPLTSREFGKVWGASFAK